MAFVSTLILLIVPWTWHIVRPWSLIKKVAQGAARGMNYLHSGSPPILHRDLKSANLLLDECYNAKIADFGFSRLKAQQQQSMTGNCGTVQWVSVKRILGLIFGLYLFLTGVVYFFNTRLDGSRGMLI